MKGVSLNAERGSPELSLTEGTPRFMLHMWRSTFSIARSPWDLE